MSAFACICGVICHLIIYFSKNFWLIMFGFTLYGLGIGMGYYPILKTTWKYYPNRKGFLTGFILCAFGLCPMVFTSIADAVINPSGKDMINEYYPDDVAKKMKNFSLIMAITMGVCGILSQILMFPLDHIISDNDNNTNTNNEDNINKNQTNENDLQNKKKELLDEEDTPKEENNQNVNNIIENEPFKEAVKSWRFLLFNLMSVGTLCK